MTNTILKSLAVGGMLALTATSLAAQESERFTWSGTLAEGRTVYLHNVNGAVRFEVGSGNAVEVEAMKRSRRGDLDEVRIEARESGGNIIICALRSEGATCTEDGIRGERNRDRRMRGEDVSVEFTVRVPRHARVEAGTVNGDVTIPEIAGSVRASTVNGDVEARSSEGRVEASTVNGSITVGGKIDGGVEYSTVNGSITIDLPAEANADVDLSTVNGRIATEFPITFDGTINPRRIRASLGSGGPTLRARTVNGSIRLRKQ